MAGDSASTLGSLASALAALLAVAIAAAALRATRRAAVANPLLQAIGELIEILEHISDQGYELSKLGREGELASRDTLRSEFRRLKVASTKVAILEPAMTDNSAYGE
jgi:hypothetical protein